MNQSGGVQGGASAFSGLSDVAISSPSTGQVPIYNSGTSKWENGPLSADEIAAAMAGEDLDLENLGLHGGYGNISASIAQMFFDHIYNGGSYEFRCNNVRVGGFPLTPSDMPYSAVGATFTNDGNWYNLYSLAQGTHTGEFKIACALFGGLVTFSIAGTSISLISDGWGGSFADVTAASGKIAFRVSGGYLQINVGTGISSTPKKFLAFFFGTVN
jgi:hypothetical protein